MYSIWPSGLFVNLLSMFTSQQAFNAAVAINHMKKLQLAHSELVLRQASIPDIKVIDVSSPTKNCKRLDPDKLDHKVAEANGKAQGTNHIPLPSSHVEPKSHYHTLKASQSECGAHHAPTMAEQGKNVYHSEPANLNGFVFTSSDVANFEFSDITAELMHDESFLFSPTGMVRTIVASLCRLEFAQSCEGYMRFTCKKSILLGKFK